jgi:hypothetical protein
MVSLQEIGAHLILLLVKAGIGQTSDLGRASVLSDPVSVAEWKITRRLPEDEVLSELEPSS